MDRLFTCREPMESMNKKTAKILLVTMPDVAMSFKRIGDIPNLGLASLAAALPEHEVRILDLHKVFKRVSSRLMQEVQEFQPDIIGFSSMSYQFSTARKLAKILKDYNPNIPIVLGGYHASMTYMNFAEEDSALFDFLVRGEGETPFRSLVNTILSGQNEFSDIASVSHHQKKWVHNPAAKLEDVNVLPLPKRDARVIKDFNLFGKKIDTVETSRGCTLPCNFCSISKMYGPTFRLYSIKRVIEDISSCKAAGTEIIFFVDDNITLDIPRFKELCSEIIRNGLDDIEYITQVSVNGMAKDPELAELMGKAGFNLVFLGIENVSPEQLKEMKKGDIRKATERAIAYCHDNGIAVMGGFIAGLPDDGKKEIKYLFQQARRLGVDHIMVQCVTPYPNTELRENYLKAGLVENIDDFSLYNGYICNVKTKKLSTGQLNRLLNWENIKLYFNPNYIRANRMLQRKDASKWVKRVFINSLEHFPAYFTNKLFLSKHSL